MNVNKIMRKSIVTVSMDDTLKTVKDIFDNVRFHHLLVVEEGELVGVISDRDLFKALSPNVGTAAETARDMALLNRKVHQIMSRNLITLYDDAGFMDVIKFFNRYNVSCIPVINRQKKPVGIISWRDVFREIESMRD